MYLPKEGDFSSTFLNIQDTNADQTQTVLGADNSMDTASKFDENIQEHIQTEGNGGDSFHEQSHTE